MFKIVKKIRLIITALFTICINAYATDFVDLNAVGYHYEICNSCTSEYNFKKVALSEATNNLVVVANLNTGVTYSYDVEIIQEPGFEGRWATSASTPSEASDATQKIVSWYTQMEQLTGQSISRDNPLITIFIPSTINGVNTGDARTVITNISSSDAVSNYLRTQTIKTLMDLLSTGFKLIVLKLNITVNTRFEDGSTADWLLVNPLESKQPYRHINGTAKDSQGNQINDPATGAASGSGSEGFNRYNSNSSSESGSITYMCFSYSVRATPGGLINSSQCMFTRIP